MSEMEIALARAYLTRSGQDPVAALIRAVRDLARMRRLASGRPKIGVELEFARVAAAARFAPEAWT